MQCVQYEELRLQLPRRDQISEKDIQQYQLSIIN